MRMFLRFRLNLCILAVAFAPNEAAAQAIRAVGRIVSVAPKSAVQIRRAAGEIVDAEPSLLLISGDKFSFRKRGIVRAIVNDTERTYTERSIEKRIPARSIGVFASLDAKLIDPFVQLISRPRWSLPVTLTVRDGELPGEIRPSSLLPTGKQYRLGTGRLAVVWSGGRTELRASDDHGNILPRLDTGRGPWAVFDIRQNTGAIQIASANGALRWEFIPVNSAPCPPWWSSCSGAEMSEAQRLSRAVWILRKQSPEWRSFALSELATLTEGGNFIAKEFWQAARSGELVEYLTTIS